MAQPAPRAPQSVRRQQPRRYQIDGAIITITPQSPGSSDREALAHAPVPQSGNAGQKKPSQTPPTEASDFDEPAPLPEEEEEAPKTPSHKKEGEEAATPPQDDTVKEDTGTSQLSAERPWEGENPEEAGEEGGSGEQDGSRDGGHGEGQGEQTDGGAGTQEEREKKKGREEQEGAARGRPQGGGSESGEEGQQGHENQRRLQKQRQARAKQEAEKKAASSATEALEKKLNPAFMGSKEFLLTCWRSVIASFGLTLIAITAYYLSVFCFHPPGVCEPGEEFDVPGDKSQRNTFFTVGVTALTIFLIALLAVLLVIVIFLSLCATPTGFLDNWSQCLEVGGKFIFGL